MAGGRSFPVVRLVVTGCATILARGGETAWEEPRADPHQAFLERFGDTDVPVRPISSCELLNASNDEEFRAQITHRVVDRATGDFGLLVVLGPMRWLDETRAEAHVLIMQGAFRGASWQCEVAWLDGWQASCPSRYPL